MSCAQASKPPTEIAAITKSAPASDSRWSVVLVTVSAADSPSINLSPSRCITSSRWSSMSISVTCESPSTGEEISRRSSSGTKLELPPPMIVTFLLTALVLSLCSAHRVVAHGQDRCLEDPARAWAGDGIDDGVGDFLGAQHAGKVGILRRAPAAHRELGLDAAGGEDRAANALAVQLVVERAQEADLGVLAGAVDGLALGRPLAG